ncbi:MAG: PKD domain-containing protein [Bacteroidales bacterium]|jgi:PKD repeat protein|nr:PKD domain-containing protein [Bacteroidales bacterium]
MKTKINLVFWSALCAITLFSCKEKEEAAAPLPVAGFSFVAEQANPLTVHFTDESENASSYKWDFGDQSAISTEKDPIHTYAGGGTYTVSLTAVNSDGKSDTKTLSVEVIQPVPPEAVIVANFSFQAGETNSLIILFTDQSENATAFSWNFGDNSEISAERNPTHRYAAGGSYEVTLTASNNNGASQQKTTTISVTAPAGPVADFEYHVDQADPMTVHFTDHSENAVSYSWNFGDGSATSNAQNPDHTYAAGGVYEVVLTIQNVNGDQHQKTVEITIVDPSAPVPLAIRTTDHNATQLTITTGEGEWELAITGGTAHFFLDAPQGVNISTATHYILSFEAQFVSGQGDYPIILFLQAEGWPNSIIDHDLGYKISNTNEWQTLSIDLTLVRRPGSADPNNNVSQLFPATFNFIKLWFSGMSQSTVKVRNFVARMAINEEEADVPATVRSTDNNQCTITGTGSDAGWDIAIPANSNDPYFFVDFSVPPLWGANHVLSFESKLDVTEADLCMFVGRTDGGYYLSEQHGLKIRGSSEWQLHTYDLHALNFFIYGPYVPLQWLRVRVGTDNAAKNLSIRNIKMTHLN